MKIFFNILLILDVLVAVFFIFIVTIQSSKSEGLTGGGATASSSHAKPGFEDQMSRITLYIAVIFMGLTAIVSVLQSHIR